MDIVDSSDTVSIHGFVDPFNTNNLHEFKSLIDKYVYQVLVEEIDYGDEDSVKQATDLLLQKELVSEVGGSSREELRKQLFNLILQQVIQEHNVEQEIITAEDEFKIIEHADIAMDDNLGTQLSHTGYDF